MVKRSFLQLEKGDDDDGGKGTVGSCIRETTDVTKCTSASLKADDGTFLSARETCKKVQEKASNIWDAYAAYADNYSPVGLIKALGAPSKSGQKMRGYLDMKINTDTILDQMATCENVATSYQSNRLGPSKQCYALLKTLPADAIERAIKRPLVVSNVQQINSATDVVECQARQAIDALSKMDASIDNAALQTALNKASGLLSTSSSDQETCNTVSNTMDACKYLSQTQCCSNLLSTMQSNTIDSCSGTTFQDILQKNASKTFSTCNTAATSSLTAELADNIVNKSTQDAKNSSEGLSSGAIIAIAVAVVVVVLATTVGTPLALGPVLRDVVRDYGLIIAGFTILGISAGVFLYWNYTKRGAFKRVNRPFANCKSAMLAMRRQQRGTLAEIKKIASSDGSTKGFDFFPDDVSTDANALDEAAMGLGVFYATVDRTEQCRQLSDTTKSKCLSFYQAAQDDAALILATMTCIVGIGTLTGGIVHILAKTWTNRPVQPST